MTFIDCDEKMGSNEETMCDDTVETRRDGWATAKTSTTGPQLTVRATQASTLRERGANCDMSNSAHKQRHNEVNQKIHETRPRLLVVRMTRLDASAMTRAENKQDRENVAHVSIQCMVDSR